MATAPNAGSSGWLSTSVFAVATLAALQVGTGGLPTEKYYKARGDKGYLFARYELPAVEEDSVVERTAAEDLARIREVFKFGVTELALLFGVSRQAVYDWQSGKAIGSENLSRLQEVSRASELIAAADIQNAAYVLRRTISDGKTFLEIVKGGGNAEAAARDLIAMLRRENDQRARLESRLGNRQNQKLRSASLGAPMLNEEG
jgi:hypothetical protein